MVTGTAEHEVPLLVGPCRAALLLRLPPRRGGGRRAALVLLDELRLRRHAGRRAGVVVEVIPQKGSRLHQVMPDGDVTNCDRLLKCVTNCYLHPVFHPQVDGLYALGLPLVRLPVPRRLDQVVLHQHQAVLHVGRHSVGREPPVHLQKEGVVESLLS